MAKAGSVIVVATSGERSNPTECRQSFLAYGEKKHSSSSIKAGSQQRNKADGPYNFSMAHRIVCPCVTRPQCGTWIVVRPQSESGIDKPKMSTRCPAPNCGKEFEFDWTETRVYEVPLELFERRNSYRSELQEAGT